jgi:hypothetical protein
MKAHVVRIGNSRGIRIPKSVIEQCQLHGAVDLIVQQGQLVVGRLPKHEPAGIKPSNRCIATETTNCWIVTHHRLPSGIGKTGHGSFPVRCVSRAARSYPGA